MSVQNPVEGGARLAAVSSYILESESAVVLMFSCVSKSYQDDRLR